MFPIRFSSPSGSHLLICIRCFTLLHEAVTVQLKVIHLKYPEEKRDLNLKLRIAFLCFCYSQGYGVGDIHHQLFNAVIRVSLGT